MAQIRQVVSETLQATVRRLLPSQQGFTEDLQASNVITPIIDLTPSAEGETIPADLQRALSFQGVTAFNVVNTQTTIISNTGFYRVFGAISQNRGGAGVQQANFNLYDGTTSKQIILTNSEAGTEFFFVPFDFIVFLASGESLRANSNFSNTYLRGCTRQIADIDGNIVNPAGFSAS